MPRIALSKQVAGILAALDTPDSFFAQFQPNAGGQQEFFQSQAHELFLCGGNSSGKTYCGLAMCGYFTVEEHDIHGKPTGYTIHPHRRIRIPTKGTRGWISSYSKQVQIDNIEPDLLKILGSHITNEFIDRGVRHWVEIDGRSRIGFQWQTAGVQSYRGPKLDFIHYDEPHLESIYNEGMMRLGKKTGTAWSTLTPVVDVHKSGVRISEIMWLVKGIIEPCLRNPKAFDDVHVIPMSLDENAAYINVEFMERRWAHMSRQEREVRRSGMPIQIIGDCAFNEDQLDFLEKYLLKNPDKSVPEYGKLFYDQKETDDDFKVQFFPTNDFFPDEPEDGHIIKIWEHPVKETLGIRPTYSIGLDTAEGKMGGDFTSGYVQRDDSGAIVAGIHGLMTELEAAKQLSLLGAYYYNRHEFTGAPQRAMLAIEVVNAGKTCQTFLITGHKELGIAEYGLNCLYRRPRIDDLMIGLHIPTDDYGWYTSPRHRGYLVTAARMKLNSAVESINSGGPLLIPDIGWVSEARTFVRDNKGVFRAPPGFYDDRIISGAITDMAAQQGKFMTPVFKSRQRQQEETALIYGAPDSKGYIINKDARRRDVKATAKGVDTQWI